MRLGHCSGGMDESAFREPSITLLGQHGGLLLYPLQLGVAAWPRGGEGCDGGNTRRKRCQEILRLFDNHANSNQTLASLYELGRELLASLWHVAPDFS